MFRRFLAILLLLPMVHAPGRAMADDETPDITRLGPQVGETVPEFILPDQTGRLRTLESLMGRNGLVLVFFRSAHW